MTPAEMITMGDAMRVSEASELDMVRPAKGPRSTERVFAAGMMGWTWGDVEVTCMWCRDVVVS